MDSGGALSGKKTFTPQPLPASVRTHSRFSATAARFDSLTAFPLPRSRTARGFLPLLCPAPSLHELSRLLSSARLLIPRSPSRFAFLQDRSSGLAGLGQSQAGGQSWGCTRPEPRWRRRGPATGPLEGGGEAASSARGSCRGPPLWPSPSPAELARDLTSGSSHGRGQQ